MIKIKSTQMNDYLNFVFCFDKNYNLQAQTCIISLLEKVSEPINIFIIYSEPFSPDTFSAKINNHQMLNNLKVFHYKEQDIQFPNIGNGHVSQATYYRFFISNYISSTEEFLIYMDVDIVCINDPVLKFKTEIKKLKKSKFIIGASVEHHHDKELEVFNRLNLKKDYFNAGVLLINYKLWRKNSTGSQLLKHMELVKDKVRYWDQDVLNSYFDSKFLILSEEFNYSTATRPHYTKEYNAINDDVTFLHFSGKIKPWHIKGTNGEVSEFYHRNFRLISKLKYHLLKRNRKLDSADLLSLIFFLKVFKLDFTISFLIQSLRHLYSFQNNDQKI